MIMKNRICNISLFSAVLACITGAHYYAFGAQNTGWSDARQQQSYAGAYNQVAQFREQEAYLAAQDVPTVQTASAAVATRELPLEVEDKKLAQRIMEGDPTAPSIDELERCTMTDIRGVFKWGVPQSGIRRDLKPQCVAVVDLVDATTNKVLATTTVAAGDAIKCNIDEFPESSYSVELENVELPADEAPTMKDAEKALDKEQKQGAGFKIAAAALIGGLAGNILGPKEAGDEKLLGVGKKQMGTTALGAAAAAGLMAASSYSGKVAGDTIKSTAVSATAGMMAGNMAAGLMGSNSVLATMKCKMPNGGEKDCVAGRIAAVSGSLYDENNKQGNECWTNSTGGVLYCKKTDVSTDQLTEVYESVSKPIANVYLKSNNKIQLSQYKGTDFNSLTSQCLSRENKLVQCGTPDAKDNAEPLYQIENANITEQSKPGYAVFDKLPNKTFGYRVSDWEKLKDDHKTTMHYYNRNVSDSSVGQIAERVTTDESTKNLAEHDKIAFTPSARSAQDGSIIDLNNEARAKSTMIGAAAGGALGGFTGYQGAQNEITERWLAALQEYEGSLSNFVCVTGKRYLFDYNGLATIPSMPKTSSPTATE